MLRLSDQARPDRRAVPPPPPVRRTPSVSATRALSAWLLPESSPGRRPGRHPGPHGRRAAEQPGHAWWRVGCLTGVDYFSTIGYQPAIAFLAAGLLSPLATVVLVLVTLLGALPVYRRVAVESPRGEGSLAMLEHILPRWSGKVLILVLLAFAATDFMITITLSAADAATHLLESAYTPHGAQSHQLVVTFILIAALGGVFLRGFSEAIGIAVVLVSVYLVLNVVVVTDSLVHVISDPVRVTDWWTALTAEHSTALGIIGVALVNFPKLALGLSGFETGVLVMPQITGGAGPPAQRTAHRVAGARRLLTGAASIMAVLLLTSSFVTAVLIPAREFQPGGGANGRALAFLAHGLLGNAFGTVYDVSTIAILWFAGASAMAGLLNIVPRYLPRYGMSPFWAQATRPLVLVFTAIAFLITWVFDARVDAQAGAYATGVLVLITSAATAVTLSAHRARQRSAWLYALIAAVFVYTTVANIIERPDGLKIAACFIVVILGTSLISRTVRAFEPRAEEITYDEAAVRFVREAVTGGMLHIIANEPDARDRDEYERKWYDTRTPNRIPDDEPSLFLEVSVPDASEFSSDLRVLGEERFGYRILTVCSPAVANGIAALSLDLRDRFGATPHVYFEWTEGNPLLNFARHILLGSGEVAPVTREVLRRAEPDPAARPHVHVC
jgi:hypothetical protein